MKKTLAIILALALSLGMTTVALASTGIGTGAIYFEDGGDDAKIIDPEDPPPGTDPDDEDYDPDEDPEDPKVEGNKTWAFDPSLDFGHQDVADVANSSANYHSLTQSRTQGGRVAGVVVDNGRILTGFTVSVQLGNFAAGNTATMNGAQLKLEQNGATATNNAAAAATLATGAAVSTGITAGSTGAELFTLNNTNGSNRGIFATHWAGDLLVAQNSVTVLGEAQAALTWTVQNAA